MLYSVSFLMNGVPHCNIVDSEKTVSEIEQYYLHKRDISFVSVSTNCVGDHIKKPGMPVVKL